MYKLQNIFFKPIVFSFFFYQANFINLINSKRTLTIQINHSYKNSYFKQNKSIYTEEVAFNCILFCFWFLVSPNIMLCTFANNHIGQNKNRTICTYFCLEVGTLACNRDWFVIYTCVEYGFGNPEVPSWINTVLHLML